MPTQTRFSIFFYGCGSAGLNSLNFFFTSKIIYFFSQKGELAFIPLLLLAQFLLYGRVFDALSDTLTALLIKHLPGNFWGRRFFFLLSLPLILLSFYFLWNYPQHLAESDGGQWLWFGLLQLYFTAFTLFAIPFDTIINESFTDLAQQKLASMSKGLGGLIGIGLSLPVIGLEDIAGAGRIITLMSLPLLATVFFLPIHRSNHASAKNGNHSTSRQKLVIGTSLVLFASLLLFETAAGLFVKIIDFIPALYSSEATLEGNKTTLFILFFCGMIIGLVRAVFGKKGSRYYLKTAFWAMALSLFLIFVGGFFVELTIFHYFILMGVLPVAFYYAHYSLYIFPFLANQAENITGIAKEMIMGLYNFLKKIALALASGILALLQHHSIQGNWKDPAFNGSFLLMAALTLAASVLLIILYRIKTQSDGLEGDQSLPDEQ